MSYNGCSTASRPRFFAVSCSASSLQSSNQTIQPFFWRLSSMDLFANEHCTHPRAFANMLQHVCQSLLDIIFAPYFRCTHAWNRPLWSPSAMSAAALTHCAKIRGSIAKMRKHLKRKKRHRESQTEKLGLQQPRLQSLLTPGKEFQADLQRRPPRTLSLTKTFITYL